MIGGILLWGLRLSTLVYTLLLNWQLLTPVTIVQAGGWDKLFHFSGFFVLAAMLALGWQRISWMQWFTSLLLYAALTEVLQHFIPGRSFSIMDWLADGLGIVAGLLLSYLLLRVWPTLTGYAN